MKKVQGVLQFLFILAIVVGVRGGFKFLFDRPAPPPSFNNSLYDQLKRFNNNQNIPDYSFMNRNPVPQDMSASVRKFLDEKGGH